MGSMEDGPPCASGGVSESDLARGVSSRGCPLPWVLLLFSSSLAADGVFHPSCPSPTPMGRWQCSNTRHVLVLPRRPLPPLWVPPSLRTRLDRPLPSYDRRPTVDGGGAATWCISTTSFAPFVVWDLHDVATVAGSVRTTMATTWRRTWTCAWRIAKTREVPRGWRGREAHVEATHVRESIVEGAHADGPGATTSSWEDHLPLSSHTWPSWAVLEPIRRTSTNQKKKKKKNKRTGLREHASTSSFVASLPHESVPSLSLLRTARLHAGCAPSLRGQALVADVLSVRDHVALLHADTRKTVHVPEHEISHAPATHTSNAVRNETAVVRVVGKEGDLDPRSCEEARRLASAWDVLKQAMKQKTKVKGRVLNAVNGGHAVGLAGYVAFLPSSRCRASTSARLGVLQDFLVLSMNHATKNIVVSEPHASSSPIGASGRRRFGRDDGSGAPNRRRSSPGPRTRSDGRRRDAASTGDERGRYSRTGPGRNL
mmetsp:Transcript_4204/g.26651  ORF Transcript_4204/g.26651 Transcript_4204/m.26651 type:complete len:485 (+) Transcript_4204:2173-3627(+)